MNSRYALAIITSTNDWYGVELSGEGEYIGACLVPPDCTEERVADILGQQSPEERRHGLDTIRNQELIWRSNPHQLAHEWRGVSGLR